MYCLVQQIQIIPNTEGIAILVVFLMEGQKTDCNMKTLDFIQTKIAMNKQDKETSAD